MIASRGAVVLAMIAGLVWSGGCEKTSPSTSEENRVSVERPARASDAEPDATVGEGPAKAAPEPAAGEPLATPKEEPTPAADTPLPAAPAGEGQLAADDEGSEVIEERWPSGKLKSQTHVKRDQDGNPVKHGTYRSWYENGQITVRGQLVNSNGEGTWVYWHPNGRKKAEGDWRNNMVQGLWTYWYGNGQKKAEKHWVDGVQNGPCTTWYDSGQKAKVCSFVDGKPHGLLQTWNRDGVSLPSSTWEHGKWLGEVPADEPSTESQPAGEP